LSTIQKTIAALRQLAYGSPADAIDEYVLDEYVRIGESTAINSLQRFCRAVVDAFGDEYLRTPTQEDTERILRVNEQRGFPGMLGSLDCMHWAWKNCPSAWKRQYTGKE
jgi:hypothetical protein